MNNHLQIKYIESDPIRPVIHHEAESLYVCKHTVEIKTRNLTNGETTVRTEVRDGVPEKELFMGPRQMISARFESYSDQPRVTGSCVTVTLLATSGYSHVGIAGCVLR